MVFAREARVTTIYDDAQILATRDLPESRRRALAADVGQEAELLRSERGDLNPEREPVAIGRSRPS